ncbi:MAG: ComEC/Rec2 family competence protein [Chlorobiaceae bacterium]|nr:ComEC/Rec2 family competence protein [Chlorobiaceae bacterium]
MKRYFLPAHPALRLLACAVVGIGSAFALPVSPFAWLAVALFFCLLTAIPLLANRTRLPAGNVSALSALGYHLAVFAAFAFHASAAYRFAPSPSVLSWVGREVILSGVVDERPVEVDGRARLLLRASEVFEEGRRTAVDEAVKVVVRMPRDGRLGIREGEFVSVKGALGLIAPASNRDEFDGRWHYRLKGVHCQLFCAGPWMVRQGPEQSGFSPVRTVISPLRGYLTSAIDEHLPDGAERGFIKGMMLGEREFVPEALYDAFRLTGTAHVLAVSGLHVALLAYALNLVLQRLRVTPAGRWLSLVIVVSVIGLYSFVTGNAPSARRAAIMASVIIAGSTIGRKNYALNSLAVADLVILVFDPLDLLNPGFLMTNGAVAGILAVYPWLSGAVRDGTGLLRRLARWLWSAFSVSLAAMIGVSPVIAWYFGTYAPSGILANVPVVFFSSLAMYASFPMILSHGFAGGVAELFGLSSWLFARVALRFVELFSRLPYASVEVQPGLFGVAVFYLTFAFAFPALLSKAWGRLVLSVLTGLNLLLWHELMRPVPEPPRMVTVNFGKDIAVLLLSGNETLLVEDGRKPLDRERIRRQAVAWGLAAPTAVAGVVSPGHDEQLRAAGGGFVTESRRFVISRPADRVLRIDRKPRPLLFVSGLKRLEQADAGGADVVLWLYRFSGKEWRSLDAWIASARPRRMLLVPGPSMPHVQRGLLDRFASERPAVEVRSRNRQAAWY